MMNKPQLTSPTNEQELDINRIEEIIADHNKAMRADIASEIAGGIRSKAITDVITVKAITAHTNAEIAKARLEDTKRLTKLARIIKRYNVLGYVNAYNEAVRRDWRDIRLPVARDATLYEPSELKAELEKEVK